MDCPVNITEPNNRICEFSVTYALNSFMSGNVKFLDCNCIDGPACNELCVPICVTIDSELVADFEPEPPTTLQQIEDCYENPPDWLCGLIESFGFSYQDSTSNFGVVPYSNYLQSKPINTQQFCGSELSEVIPIVLQYYGGLDPSVFCIEENGVWGFEDNCRIKGPVEGNNLLTELAKLAQAGCANLFTQVGGKLTIEKWKDHDSAVEFAIPCEYVLSAEKAQFTSNRTTAILMRGAEVNSIDCGNNSLTNNDTGPGPVKKCVFSGIKTPSVDIKFNNLSGTSEDINNSTIVSSGDNGQTVGNITSTQDGTATGEVSAADGSQIGCTPECVDIQINGRNQTQFSSNNNGYYSQYGYNEYGGYGWGSNRPNPFDAYTRMLNNYFPIPYYMFGLGDFAQSLGPRNNSNTNGNYSDQPSRSQCEIFVTTNEDSLCGNTFEDHENRYVYSKAQLFKIAVRRMQELKLAQNSWNVELPYLPCLKINQVVTFDTPALVGSGTIDDPECPSRTIKGIIGALSVEYRKTSESELPTKMKAVIMDTACLGQTEYQSGNLMSVQCAHSGASDLSPWTAAEYSLDNGSGLNGCGFLFSVGNSDAALLFEECKLNTGCDHTISFDWEFVQGSGNVIFDYDLNGVLQDGQIFAGVPGSTQPGINSGTYLSTFTPDTGDCLNIRFFLRDAPTPTYFKIYNLTITATCTG